MEREQLCPGRRDVELRMSASPIEQSFRHISADGEVVATSHQLLSPQITTASRATNDNMSFRLNTLQI